MAPAPPKSRAIVELIYDLSSTVSYICLLTLLRYQKAWNLELELNPVYAPFVYDETGDGQPIPMAIKTQYAERDIVRLSERWGVDVRPPAGFMKATTTLPVMGFLRTVKEHESPEVLTLCTLLLYRELYSIQTPLASPSLYDCLLRSPSSSPSQSTAETIALLASTTPLPTTNDNSSSSFPTTLTPQTISGPFSPARLAELLALSTSPSSLPNIKKALVDAAKDAHRRHKLFAIPWLVAYRVPIEEQDENEKSKERTTREKIDGEGRTSDVYITADRFEAMAYFLGPEYKWNGPWPDGDRFRPKPEGTPGTPMIPIARL